MRWAALVFVLVSTIVLPMAPARAGASPPKILMRIYVQTNEGLPPSEAMPVSVPPDNEVIYIRSMPEVTEQNLAGAESIPEGVKLIFDHTGQVDLDAVTGQDQNRILVVTIDGVVVYAPIIDQQITDGVLIIPHLTNPVIVQLLQECAAKNNREAKRT